MRDIAVVLMFMVIAVAAFRRPFYGALLWVLFGLMNPHRLSFGFAYSLPFAQMAVVVTVLAAMFHARDVRWPRGVPIYILLAFVAWMGLSTANAMVPAPSWTKFVDVLKVLGMTLVVATLIRTREEIVGLVWTMVFSIGFFGFKGGIFTIGTGGSYRVWGPPGSLVEGNNELAVALIMTIPLMYFLTTHPVVARDFWPLSRIPVRLIRFGGFLAMLLCTASALGSQSRGALVAIVAMSTVLWWRSQSKLSIALVAAAAVLVALPLLPDTWWDRMETIQTYDEDLSALQRLNAWQTAINIAGDRVTGAGYATAHPVVFGIYSPNQGPEWIYVAHSIYFQVLGDHGYVGLLMYLALWVATYFTAGRTARLARQYADLAWAVTLLNMCKVSMVGYAVGGAFLSLAYWDMPYYLMVLVVVTRMLVRRQIDQRGVQMPVAAPDGERLCAPLESDLMLGPLIRWSACRGGSPRLSVFIYHRVLPEPDPLFPGELDRQRFDMQLGWIRRWFNVMPLAAAVQRLRDGSLPPAAAAITFDDGYADNLHHAAPVLQRHGMTATLFVATGFLEGGCMWNDRVIAAVRLTRHDALDLPPLLQEPLPTRTTAERQATIGALIRKIKYLEPGERDRTVAEVVAAAGIQLPRDLMLTHDELRQWHAQGHGVGGHTVNHPILARLADDQARHEIATGRDELEALLDTRIALFAYPNGKPGVDYLPVHATMVRELGFDAAVSTAWGAATARSPRFEIPRFTPWDATPARFGMRLVRNLLTS